MVDKKKSTRCISHIFGRARKWKTSRLIQRKWRKLNRRKSASTVKVKIVNERGISLHVKTIRKRTQELGRVACKKPYVNKISRGKWLKFGKEMLEKLVDFWKNVVASPDK